MKKIIISKKQDNKKIVSIIRTMFPNCKSSTIQKALRNKDIKINGSRVKEDLTVFEGDEVEVYITDELLESSTKRQDKIKIDKKRIVYEDDNILIYNKPQELEVQGKKDEVGLEELLNEYYSNLSVETHSTIIACHRLDRNTAGLVIFAKNKDAEKEMLKLIKERKITKYYKALVYGIPKNKNMTLKAYLFKDSKKSAVIIYYKV